MPCQPSGKLSAFSFPKTLHPKNQSRTTSLLEPCIQHVPYWQPEYYALFPGSPASNLGRGPWHESSRGSQGFRTLLSESRIPNFAGNLVGGLGLVEVRLLHGFTVCASSA